MRAVIQRVSRASLAVVEGGGETVCGEIGAGLVAFVGIEADDGGGETAWMAGKIANLRIFEDNAGRMNLSAIDLAATGDPPGVLVVPNFTVAGRAHKGRRPDFTGAKAPGEASVMFDALVEAVGQAAPGVALARGVFGAHMHVSIVNDGPVTIWLDSRG